jgi:hypothetical protein
MKKVLSLIFFLLIVIVEVKMSLNDVLEVFNRVTSADRHQIIVSRVLIRVDCQRHYFTLFVEEP